MFGSRKNGRVLEVATIGNPVLRQVARDVRPDEIGSGGLAELISDMIVTMHAEEGIGIAAPQVSESLQLAVIEIPSASSRYPDSSEFAATVFINPRITVLDDAEHEYWEGCLSVPGLRGLVQRPRQVRVDYLDAEGSQRSLVAEDFLATVVQHELDHLQGMLFVDRLRDTTKLATVEDYRRYWVEQPGEGDPL